MQCIHFERRIQSILDQRGNPGDDQQIMEHAAVCSPCSELLEGHETLHRGLAAVRTVSSEKRISRPRVVDAHAARETSLAPVQLVERKKRSDEVRRFRQSAAVVTAIVAALLLNVFLLRLDHDQRPTAARLERENAAATSYISVAPPKTDATAESEFSEDLATPVEERADMFHGWADFAPSAFSLQFEDSTASASLLLLTDRIRPLAEPFVVIINVLRRSLNWRPTTNAGPAAVRFPPLTPNTSARA